jgi:FkbM family methyltransferase|tara:strand:+ start:305 stop:865 length:561 start_codon:yes stop_codon:yes gene_type:complete
MSERKIIDWALPYVKQFNTYIDIGAHDGDTSVPFIDMFERIICFEPNPNSFKILSSNPKLECYNIALGDDNTHGILVMNDITNNPEHGSIHIDRTSNWQGEKFEVEIKRLDSFKFFENVDFIKIDVEQFEYFVIQGALKTIKKNRPTIFFENKRKEADTVALLLLSIGYTVRKWKSDTIAFWEGDK